MSSWEEQSCNPFQPVVGSSSKGTQVQPEPTIGRSWQQVVVPGGDNYFQILGDPTPCFPKPWRPNDTNHLDILDLIDVGNFDITVLLDREDNVPFFQADATLWAMLEQSSSLDIRDKLEGFASRLDREDTAVISTKAQLITLQELYLHSGLRSLDSAIISLYTKASSGASMYVGSFWVFGTKEPVDAIKLVAAATLKTEQQIECLAGMNLNCKPVVVKLIISGEDKARLKDFGSTVSMKKIGAACKIGDQMFIGIGYALQGYGIGAYGA